MKSSYQTKKFIAPITAYWKNIEGSQIEKYGISAIDVVFKAAHFCVFPD